ncbi:hypothetical protein [Pseudomonas sp. NBRC 111144]|uniref:hypothetical protein n=1 Tax=Pseudomonas sp. NBRC 111144 TaxID=1661059 RepID=UPI0006D3BDBD|nr:hypothetical protein [Pseudomonas sp. NBRC 111144]
MDYEPLPSTWVIDEARAFLRAAQVLEVRAKNDPDTNLYWPAVMNSALACELFLKSLLVEADPRYPRSEYDPDGNLRLRLKPRGNGHNLSDLYNAIPNDLAVQFRAISKRLSPGFELEKWISISSNLFVGTRYPYEAGSVQGVDLDVLNLAPHLDQVLYQMTQRRPTSHSDRNSGV